MADILIVSRHPAAIEFCRSHAPFAHAEVLTGTVSASDVRGRVVAGVLPFALAAECARFYAVEFTGAPPRGQEYSCAEMRAAGARLVEYRVVRVGELAPDA